MSEDAATTTRTRRTAVAIAIVVTGSVSIAAMAPASIGTPNARASKQPPEVRVTGTASHAITLAWRAPAAPTAAVEYGVYVNGGRVAATRRTTHAVMGLACGRTYRLGVDVLAATGRRSASTSLVRNTKRCSPASLTSTTARALPFGAWGNYPEAWGGTFSGGQITVTPENMLQRLTTVRAAGMRVVVSMAAGSKSDYQNDDDTFNIGMWKARLDAFRRVDFSAFLRDGTIVAQMLIDDLDESHWGDKPISNRELDELARYSKQFWPTLRTAVRARPTSLTTREYGGSGRPYDWRFLDAAWDQYSASMGNPAAQVAAEVAAAKRHGLALVVGLNVLTGGDGSSGLPGPDKYSSRWAMSPAELVRYGTPLIRHPYACAFLMWSAKYDYSSSYADLEYRYFRRPEIQQAMRTLRALADRRSAPRCSALGR